ncbi:ABC transporter substrate-binding protein [Ruminiclostridium cellobioparum]|uniref:ABC-type sugar transport system, periplasmic component n=1 Tax=Ruminiclostridium cellobioparum subsp. termitidis CT1112 TaxID=1195236 RepID=S0FFK3_RUMCE|nr:extracellular solute-binding protein [Ruminiclostridium cellobioparum]EMS69765.1 ABC-type sugar transport system, periplasmic component [Ruminiclostridium cellobioparum subsp. termitidis CT1112]
MRVKLIKGLGCVLSLALTASVFAGCGSSENAVSTQSSSSQTDNVKMQTVRVWTNDNQYQPIIDPIVAQYNSGEGTKDGINIEYKIFGGDYNDVLKVALAAEQGPEIYKFVGTVKEPFIKSKWMLPIDDLPGGPEFLKKYENILIKGYTTFDGKTYSIPFKVLNTKFMYNKTLLEKSGFTAPPETWDDVVAYARKITEDNKGEAYGYGIHLKDTASSGKWYFATQFATSVGHMGYDFKEGKFKFSDFTGNIGKILQMKADGSIFPGAEGMGLDECVAQFAAGRIAMMPGVSWDVNGVAKLGYKFEMGVCDTPVLSRDKKFKGYAQIADALCIGPSAENMPEKAMKVYELVQSDEIQTAIQEQEVDFIAREDIQQKSSGNFTKAGTKEFADTSRSYFTLTPPDGGITVEGQPYQNTIINLVAGSDPDIAKVLADLDKRYNTALEKAVADGFDMTLYIDKEWDTSFK